MHNELSDNQRRFACRILFLLLCALPTAFIIYQACHRKSADDWAQLIQSQLSLETQIGSVETPRPNEAVLRDIRFADENGNEIFSAMEATILFGEVNRIIVKDQLRMTSAGLNQALNNVAKKVVNPHLNQQKWTIDIREALIASDQDSLSGLSESLLLSPVVIDVVPDFEGVRATMSTPIQGQDLSLAENWVTCQIEKNRNSNQFKIELDTRDSTPLPCWLAFDWFPELRKFGYQSGFAGRVVCEPVNEQLSTSLVGDFHGVDISSFVDGRMAIANKPSSIHVRNCNFANLNDLDAWLELADGTREPIRTLFSEVREFNIDMMIRAAAIEGHRQSAEAIYR